MPSKPKINVYKILLAQVRQTLLEGQRRIEEERGRIYWEAGDLIYKDILKHKNRGKRNAEVTKRLSKDLKVDLSTLQRCVQFAKMYPDLPKVGAHRLISWTHYLKLITIPDDKMRLSLEKDARDNAWTTKELAAQIQERKTAGSEDSKPAPAESAKPKPAEKLLTPLRGKLFHISDRMMKIALQSAVGGMLASIVGMGFAAAGILTPVMGAIVQEAIDLFAVLNALRVALPPKNLTDFNKAQVS